MLVHRCDRCCVYKKEIQPCRTKYRGIWAILMHKMMFPSESCNSVSNGTFCEFRPFSVIAENHWHYIYRDRYIDMSHHFCSRLFLLSLSSIICSFHPPLLCSMLFQFPPQLISLSFRSFPGVFISPLISLQHSLASRLS